MKKTAFIAVSIVLVLILAAVSTATARPAGDVTGKPTQEKTPGAKATENAVKKETRETGKGTKKFSMIAIVDSVDIAVISVKTNDGSLLTCGIDAETRIRIPGNQDAALADIAVGSRIHLQALELEEGCLVLKINAIPGKPEKKHHVGTVSAYEAGVSITITALDGTEATFLITGDTKILPEERMEELSAGWLVTIISPRDVAGDEWEADGIVVHPEGSGTDVDSNGE